MLYGRALSKRKYETSPLVFVATISSMIGFCYLLKDVRC